jgi:hypothetical protein
MGHPADVSWGCCFEVGQADLSVTRMVEARLGPPDEGEVPMTTHVAGPKMS